MPKQSGDGRWETGVSIWWKIGGKWTITYESGMCDRTVLLDCIMKKSLLLYSTLVLLCASCSESSTNAGTVSSENVDTPPAMQEPPDPVVYEAPKVFYYDYTEQRGVEEALVMSKEDALKEMQNLPASDGNFFGMELTDGSIVQFMYDEKKATWFLDIPNVVTQESFNADVSRDEMLEIIADVFGGKTAEEIQLAYK